jgi:hypothetical protein
MRAPVLGRGQTIRLANLAIRDFANQAVGEDDPWEFLCECGCFTFVELTMAEFDAADGVWVDGHRPEQEVIAAAR